MIPLLKGEIFACKKIRNCLFLHPYLILRLFYLKTLQKLEISLKKSIPFMINLIYDFVFE